MFGGLREVNNDLTRLILVLGSMFGDLMDLDFGGFGLLLLGSDLVICDS